MHNLEEYLTKEPEALTFEAATKIVDVMEAYSRRLRAAFLSKGEYVGQADLSVISRCKNMLDLLEKFSFDEKHSSRKAKDEKTLDQALTLDIELEHLQCHLAAVAAQIPPVIAVETYFDPRSTAPTPNTAIRAIEEIARRLRETVFRHRKGEWTATPADIQWWEQCLENLLPFLIEGIFPDNSAMQRRCGAVISQINAFLDEVAP